MSKRVNLISNENQKIDNFENINLSELDSVFNYSCEILICKYFSLFDESVASKALDILLEKIKPKGQIIIGISNLKEISADYIRKQISNEDFFHYIKNIHNHFGMHDIILYIEKNQSFAVTEVNKDEYEDYLTIARLK